MSTRHKSIFVSVYAVAHFYLSKGKNFNETLELEGNYQFQSEASFVNASDSNIPTGMTNAKALDREAKQIHSAEVLDISVNGYRIKWTGITPANLKNWRIDFNSRKCSEPVAWRSDSLD